MTDATPDQIAFATAIANKLVPLQVNRYGPEWLAAHAAALAAIIETEARVNERAAKWLTKQPSLIPISPDHVGSNSPRKLAAAIRSGEHMKGEG